MMTKKEIKEHCNSHFFNDGCRMCSLWEACYFLLDSAIADEIPNDRSTRKYIEDKINYERGIIK